MARDKLITIRIEGEKRDLFNQLAKSQNTDTASLLYDFISGCLDGTLDVRIVKGKGNRLDNQIDTNRIDNQLDKLETATQRLDERLGIITKKLNDWIEAFDDRLTDCDRGLSEKITSLEHRLNALSIQLDSQKDSQETTTQEIDTDSQKDSQRIDDMEHLLKREKECSIASIDGTVETDGEAIETIEETDSTVEDADTVETANEPVSTVETVTDAIESLAGDNSPMNDAGEGEGEDAIETLNGEISPIETSDKVTGAIEKTNKEKAAILGIHASNLTKWIKKQEIPDKYLDKCRFNHDKTKIILI